MIRKLMYVACDVCGTPCGDGDDMRDNRVMARMRARELGWVRRAVLNGDDVALGDVCPQCQTGQRRGR